MYVKIGKRVFDISISLCSVIVFFPLMLIIALFIKLVDPGPVLFAQQRVGRFGKMFKFYKFRSMPINTGDIPSDKMGEIELSWIGRFIRRTNIDELPQLINILRGDMSLVGPRPPLLSQSELINARESDGVLICFPGLTGLAQINSFDGMKVEQKANFDKSYAESISFLNDVKIILKTFLYLFKKPPVY